MRLTRVVLLVNLALGVGFSVGYLWREWEIGRLTLERNALKQELAERPGDERTWSVRGIVRDASPQTSQILITHEEIPGLMGGAMTMSFRAEDSKLARGLKPGDYVRFTVRQRGQELVVVALQKERTP